MGDTAKDRVMGLEVVSVALGGWSHNMSVLIETKAEI